MLVPIVEAPSEGAPTRGEGALTPPSERRGVGAVLGVVLGLALIVACLVFVLRQPAGGIDGDARLRAAFDLGALPYELEVVNSAQLFKGEESVVLANPRAEPEPPKNPVPEKSASPADSASTEKSPSTEKSVSPESSEITPPEKDESKAAVPEKAKPRYDWSKLAMGEARPPRQLALMWYPPGVGDAEIKQQFGESGRMSVRDVGDEGGLTEVESGTLVWGPYAPAFAHERLFEAGRTFRDSLRVNLSTPGQYCVMVVTWPRNSPGAKAHVDEILKALAPKSIPEAAR